MSSGVCMLGWSKRNNAFASATGKWLWNLTTYGVFKPFTPDAPDCALALIHSLLDDIGAKRRSDERVDGA